MAAHSNTYAVWVGNLNEEITKQILLEEFECYGTIVDVKKQGDNMAFIIFNDRDVAENAANDMDGESINGIEIIASFKDDMRPFTDCQYFMQWKNCIKSCKYRHEEAARCSTTVCEKWRRHQCKEKSCNERHPGSKELNSKELNSKDVDQKSVGVYWDIENCQLPSHIDPHSFVEKIRSEFIQGRKLAEFLCVCDNTRIKKSVIDGLSNEGVDVIHVSATAKNASDDKLKLRIQDFGYKYKEQAFVILISGDVNFAPVLNTLRYSLNVYTVLIHNKQASEQLTKLADNKYNFDDFIADIAITASPSIENGSVRTKELSVHNLPFEQDKEEEARRKLGIISGNCGGRILTYHRDNATGNIVCIMGFPSAHDAERALIRMEGRYVCGRKISVEPYLGEDTGKKSTGWGIDSLLPTNEKKRIPRSNMQGSVSLSHVDSPKFDQQLNHALKDGNPVNQTHSQRTRMKKASSENLVNATKTFAVYVQNLPDGFSEVDLRREFNTYGNISSVNRVKSKVGKEIGFVNFYSKDSAEKAENEMNNKNINGFTIQVSLKKENYKKKDVRPLTDCRYFMQQKTCKEPCIFRHEVSALLRSTVCAEWLKHQCNDKFCKERHPSGQERNMKNKILPKLRT